jgi:voltage-gated potassium channel
MKNTGTGFRRESLRRLVNKRWFGITILGGILAIIFLGSLFLLLFEKKHNPEINTYGDALWLSFVTMTTVGYGDKVPITMGGKVTAVGEMVFGLALLTIFITSRAAKSADKAARRAKGLDEKTRLRDHFVVLGWNTRGEFMLKRLANTARDKRIPIVLLAELDGSPVEDELIFFYHGSPVSTVDLNRVNVLQARSVTLLADEVSGGKPSDIDARTVLAALTVQSLNPDVRMTAEVLEPDNVRHLERAGVEEVFDHNVIGGNLLAQSAMKYGIIEIVTALAKKQPGSSIYLMPVRPELVGMSADNAARQINSDEGITLLAVRSGEGLTLTDTAQKLTEGDTLLVLSAVPLEGASAAKMVPGPGEGRPGGE